MAKIDMIITRRNLEEKVLTKAQECGGNLFITIPAKETFSGFLGLGTTEKSVIICDILDERMDEFINYCYEDLKFLKRDRGVVITLNKKGDSMKKFDLISIVITEGYTEMVLDILKTEGATGATIVDARGSGNNFSSFFGTNVASAKDLILCVVPTEITDKVVSAVSVQMNKAGGPSGVCFSLPVDNFTGINVK